MTPRRAPPREFFMNVFNDPEHLRAFAAEIDQVKQRLLAEMGEEDVRHVKRLNRFSRGMEIAGRVLIHVSLEPVSFSLGVVALWIHKQLQVGEIGHTTLHGTYDRLEGAEKFRSQTFDWDVPVDEESWREGHNVKHHGNTNIAGRDGDIHSGPVRLTKETPHRWYHRIQLPVALAGVPSFGFLTNLHFTGVIDLVADNGIETKLDFLPDRSPASRRLALKRAFRKYVPYYFKNFVFFPALAGPFWWKVLLGNWLAETLRDVFSAAVIYCGHVGPEVESFPIGTKANSRGHWYAMQVAATSNFQVSGPMSILCGGLDYQIEHHLFPTVPPQRIRKVAPEVRAICERYGVPYKTDTWGRTLKKAIAHVVALSRPGVKDARRESEVMRERTPPVATSSRPA